MRAFRGPGLPQFRDDGAWLGAILALRGAMSSLDLDVTPQVSEVPLLIEWIGSRCGAEGLAEDATLKMTLAIEEAVINVITHAFEGLPLPHSIKVRLDITAASVTAEIIDNGQPFDPTSAPDPDLSPPLEERRPGGLGIHLMRSMTDRLHYRRSDGRNILRLETARR
jgi:anti-sigma regulatory factor (Ser/Thr protein kinase)